MIKTLVKNYGNFQSGKGNYLYLPMDKWNAEGGLNGKQ